MIRQLKLTNGEDIIAEVEELKIDENVYTLKLTNTRKIMSMVDSHGNLKIGFVSWFLVEDGDQIIFLVPSHVVAYSNPSKSILTYYNKTVNGEDSDINDIITTDTIQ